MNQQNPEFTNSKELVAENERLKKEILGLSKALGQVHLENQCQKEIIEALKKKYQEHLSKLQKKSLPT